MTIDAVVKELLEMRPGERYPQWLLRYHETKKQLTSEQLRQLLEWAFRLRFADPKGPAANLAWKEALFEVEQAGAMDRLLADMTAEERRLWEGGRQRRNIENEERQAQEDEKEKHAAAVSQRQKRRHAQERPVLDARDAQLNALMLELLQKGRADESILMSAEKLCSDLQLNHRFNPHDTKLTLTESGLRTRLGRARRALAKKKAPR